MTAEHDASTKVDAASLEEVVRRWIADAVELVRSTLPTDPPSFVALVKQAHTNVMMLPSFEAACRATMVLPGTEILARRIHPRDGDTKDQLQRWAAEQALEFLLLKLGDRGDPGDGLIGWSEAFADFHALLVERRMVVRMKAPLYGLSLPEPIECGKVQVVPLDPPGRLPRHAGAFRAECSAQLEATQVQTFGDSDSQGFPATAWFTSEAESCVRALRLWMEIDIRPAGIFCDYSLANMIGGPVFPLPSTHYVSIPRELRDPALFAAFCQRTSTVLASPPPGLAEALRRFDVMYDVPRDSDRIVDQMIILESLFQKGDEKQELTYRLSLRVARFIGETPVERREVFRLLKDAYKERSNIVHGNQDSGGQNVHEKTSALVHRVLRTYCERVVGRLAERKLQARICDDLDDLALT